VRCVIRTYTGREVNPLDLRPEDIDIQDIAHALACCNRFAGHAREPISVAQHSVYVSRLCGPQGHGLQGLLHDASEAYLGDVTKWLKATPEFEGYRRAEHHAQQLVYRKFGCPAQEPLVVEWADRVMIRIEWEQSFQNFTIDHPSYPSLTDAERQSVGNWGVWSWREARDAFLMQFQRCNR
jgi:uncharacterized protein